MTYSFGLDEAFLLGLGYPRGTTASDHFAKGLLDNVGQSEIEAISLVKIARL